MWLLKVDINHAAWCRLTSKALDERRTLGEQAAWELEQAMMRWARQQARAGLADPAEFANTSVET